MVLVFKLLRTVRSSQAQQYKYLLGYCETVSCKHGDYFRLSRKSVVRSWLNPSSNTLRHIYLKVYIHSVEFVCDVALVAIHSNSGLEKDAERYLGLAEKWFVFSMVWSVMAAADEDGRAKLDTFLRDVEASMFLRSLYRTRHFESCGCSIGQAQPRPQEQNSLLSSKSGPELDPDVELELGLCIVRSYSIYRVLGDAETHSQI